MPDSETPAPVEQPQAVDTPPTEGPAGEPSEPVLAADEAVVGNDADGKPVTVADLKASGLRQADYTKKTQAVAAERHRLAEAATVLERREQALTETLGDPAKVLSMITGQQRQQQQPAITDGDVPTWGHVRSAINDLRGAVASEITHANAEQGQAVVVRELEATATQAIADAVGNHPLLEKIPHVGDTLKRMAGEDKPADLQAMTAAIVAAGDRLAKDLGEKPHAKKVARELSQGIEPPGGVTAPPPPQKDYMKDGGRKVDWASLDKDVDAWLQSQEG